MRRYSRRQVLKLSGGALAAASFAPLLSRAAMAQELPTGQTLDFWWWGEQEAPGLEQWVNDSVRLYQEMSGNTIEPTLQDTSVVISEFQTASAANAAPDLQFLWNGIYHMESVWFDYLEPLNDLLDEEFLAKTNATPLSVFQGQQYRTGWYSVPLLWVYNKDIFDEFNVDYPPEDGNWDWQDLTEMATQLTQDRDGDGQIDLWGLHLERGGWFYWPRMFGGDIVNPDDDTDCWLDHEKTQEAYNWIWDNQWRRQPNIIAQPAQVENQWYLNAFVPGWVAIAEKGLYPGEAAEAIGDQIRWDYAHVPNGPETRVSLGDADGWSIWKGTRHLGLDDPTAPVASTQPARISGIKRQGFPEPTGRAARRG